MNNKDRIARDKGCGKGTWVDSSAELKEESPHQDPLPREVGSLDDLAPCPKGMDRDPSHRAQKWVFIKQLEQSGTQKS